MSDNHQNTNTGQIVGVSFEDGGKVYHFRAAGVTVSEGTHVLTETEQGVDIGRVVFVDVDPEADDTDRDLKPLLRRATADDIAREQLLQQREVKAASICERKIQEHDLPMNLIDADYSFDGEKLLFFFSAENRVDFRELVRDLAATFDCRIELRQIGVRDEAKMTGGLGPCGRTLCCCRWMREFKPVPIKLAKEQDMSLNSAKISGLCNRLMCCLRFEKETYRDLRERLPGEGDEVRGQGRTGHVTNVELLNGTVTVQFDDEQRPQSVDVDTDDLRDADDYWRLIGTHWPQRMAPPPIPDSDAEDEQSDNTHQQRRKTKRSGRDADDERDQKQTDRAHSDDDVDQPQVIMREPQRNAEDTDSSTEDNDKE